MSCKGSCGAPPLYSTNFVVKHQFRLVAAQGIGSVGLSPFAHARQRCLEQLLGFFGQFPGRPFFFVHAKAFVVRPDGKFLALLLRHVRTMNFQMIAIRVVKIDFCAFRAGARHRTDERDMPSLEMLGPFSQVLGGGIERQVRMGLIPMRLAEALFEKIDFESWRETNADLQ